MRELVYGLAASLGQNQCVRVVSTQVLEEISAPRERLDIRSEVLSGFPYTLSHASSVAELLAELLCNPAPKKGLITDLDDMLWAGILGEIESELPAGRSRL